ncbi:MAG: hypothetical protein ACLPKB_21235 [Xanthobacteraceae bacterium]
MTTPRKGRPENEGRAEEVHRQAARPSPTPALSEGNPRREGTGRHAAFAALRKFDGKTVEAYFAAEGDGGALRGAVRHGWAKLEGGQAA